MQTFSGKTVRHLLKYTIKTYTVCELLSEAPNLYDESKDSEIEIELILRFYQNISKKWER